MEKELWSGGYIRPIKKNGEGFQNISLTPMRVTGTGQQLGNDPILFWKLPLLAQYFRVRTCL
ncbi:hypothetical protein K0M31_009963 [Melipona bicolor]|uniref:Uncharacterized protein n=1 Tax=Melipona bicolor TaxID=60889 RepID=A0AA40FNJ1_9HYME|nr:hypothetical protein K0M31_009963 [Melipona bicolor]